MDTFKTDWEMHESGTYWSHFDRQYFHFNSVQNVFEFLLWCLRWKLIYLEEYDNFVYLEYSRYDNINA